ncbi:hypothetical protein ACIRPQ_28870 [Streptomyces sp. NPDC101213]
MADSQTCPDCKQLVGTRKGTWAPHQKKNSRESCPRSGEPA